MNWRLCNKALRECSTKRVLEGAKMHRLRVLEGAKKRRLKLVEWIDDVVGGRNCQY